MRDDELESEIERKFPLEKQLEKLEQVRCGLSLPLESVSIWKKIRIALLTPVRRLG